MKKLKILTHATQITDIDDQYDQYYDTIELRKERIEHKMRQQVA